MQTSKFTTLCLGYSGLLITLIGAMLFVFVDAMELDLAGASSLAVFVGGLAVLNKSRQRWQRARASERVFGDLGVNEYISAGVAAVITGLFIATVGLVL